MISESKNKAVTKPKKKENEKPEFGNESQCPNCGRTNFSRICRCPKCGKVRCDRCNASQGPCNCKKVKKDA